MNISVSKGVRINEDNYSIDMDGMRLAMLQALVNHGNSIPGQSDEAKAFYQDLDAKIAAAFSQKDNDPIVAIQVVPVIEPDDEEADVIAQPEGPTEETTAWAVYFRHQSGKAAWAADSEDEDSAMIVARELAAQNNVLIEQQAWK